jgi:hypothetical protein
MTGQDFDYKGYRFEMTCLKTPKMCAVGNRLILPGDRCFKVTKAGKVLRFEDIEYVQIKHCQKFKEIIDAR